MSEAQSVPRGTQSDETVAEPTITDKIRNLIVGGDLPIGSRIHDKQLAQEMDVSRTPVREALLQLQSEGLVTIKPQSGTFVFSLTVDDLHQICMTRSILETGAMRYSAAASPPDVFAPLGLLVSQAAVALEDENLDLCDELDWRFHESLVAITGNKFLIKAYADISRPLRALRRHMPQSHERVARAIAQHRRILDLAIAGRAEVAIEQLTAHVINVERLLASANGVIRA